MAKKKDNSGIQQAAGLIRYFDEESEDALQIPKGAVYLHVFPCPSLSIWQTMVFGNGYGKKYLDNYSDSVKSTDGISSSSDSFICSSKSNLVFDLQELEIFLLETKVSLKQPVRSYHEELV